MEAQRLHLKDLSDAMSGTLFDVPTHAQKTREFQRFMEEALDFHERMTYGIQEDLPWYKTRSHYMSVLRALMEIEKSLCKVSEANDMQRTLGPTKMGRAGFRAGMSEAETKRHDGLVLRVTFFMQDLRKRLGRLTYWWVKLRRT
ncbi:MAG: hypothetical protein Q9159_006319 [Coniocarpon cinnabarinum]